MRAYKLNNPRMRVLYMHVVLSSYHGCGTEITAPKSNPPGISGVVDCHNQSSVASTKGAEWIVRPHCRLSAPRPPR